MEGADVAMEESSGPLTSGAQGPYTTGAPDPAAAAQRAYERAHRQYGAADYDGARAACEEALRFRPSRTDVLLLLGACWFQLRDTDRCIACNREALKIDPSFAEAYGNLGNVLKELGELDSAIELYRRAISLRPTFVDAHANLAAAHTR